MPLDRLSVDNIEDFKHAIMHEQNPFKRVGKSVNSAKGNDIIQEWERGDYGKANREIND